MPKSVAHKAVVNTGASSRIGRGTALKWAMAATLMGLGLGALVFRGRNQKLPITRLNRVVEAARHGGHAY
jgi:NAD(P)-dependent dehydrogenase (short-subunit alcohol dehydrogenase family)